MIQCICGVPCRSGEVVPRPGVLQLMDDARAAGLKVAVCSAATKSSVVFTLKNLLGEQRLSSLDVFLAGAQTGHSSIGNYGVLWSPAVSAAAC